MLREDILEILSGLRSWKMKSGYKGFEYEKVHWGSGKQKCKLVPTRSAVHSWSHEHANWISHLHAYLALVACSHMHTALSTQVKCAVGTSCCYYHGKEGGRSI